MFKRISELFKPKKTEPKSSQISLDDLPAWLDTEEQVCLTLRSEQFNDSREIIEKSRQDIIQLLKDFGVEEPSSELVHPKVEQVNRLNLPQFKKKVEDALAVEFAADDEAYYQQIAEMINGCFKAYKGPGRYLHHLYGDEVKLFRQLMDQIGKELNLLTESIKNSRIRLARIQSVRDGLQQLRSADDELASAASIKKEMDDKKADLERRIEQLSRDKENHQASSEYHAYTSALAVFDEEKKKSLELFETLDALIRTALPIWRRGLRIAQDEKKKDEEILLDHLIQTAVLQQYEDPEFTRLISSTSRMLFRSIDDESIPLKNSFEKSLFVSVESYTDQITGAARGWYTLEQQCQQHRDELGTHPASVAYVSFESGILEIEREIKHGDEEAGKLTGRVHHLEREKEKAVIIIRDEMKELSDAAITVAGIESADGEE
ncbi:MAG: hypothetical protein LUQ50_14105 [Methanospirillum sp.]|uniref:hypothetical protein n=1 Tax=Methanospirillum sp. TaxID=45200 RepID=UPI0023728029|nr:hypothetical protein [Methanospirillum sp.]MDD1730189.1 hypothetical protein [Methanospirillum sp.]